MMTTDAFERRLPDLLHELGQADASELVGDVLATTSTTRQRPAWTRLGWWLASRPVISFLPDLSGRRQVLAIAIVLALLALVAIAVVGRRPDLPPSFLTSYRGEFVAKGAFAEDPGFSLDGLSQLPDERVLLLTGGSGPATIWDPESGRFSTTGTPVAQRAGPGVIGLADGRVLFIGGDVAGPDGTPSHSTAEIYDPGLGTFQPTAAMADSRWIFGAATLSDGRILIAGGTEPPGDPLEPLAGAELFDPRTGRFTATGAMNEGRVGPRVVALDDGLALVVGGTTDASREGESMSAEIFDPSTGRFSPVDPPPAIPIDTSGRTYPLGWRGPLVRLPDGRALIAGMACQEVHDMVDGYSAGFGVTPSWIFDPRSRRFTVGPTMPHCVQHAAALPNGQVLLLGWYYRGTGQLGASVRWSGLLDPGTGQVRLTAPPPGGPYLSYLVLRDGRVFTTGETDGETDTQVIYLFE
jgi:hypothetical protein